VLTEDPFDDPPRGAKDVRRESFTGQKESTHRVGERQRKTVLAVSKPELTLVVDGRELTWFGGVVALDEGGVRLSSARSGRLHQIMSRQDGIDGRSLR